MAKDITIRITEQERKLIDYTRSISNEHWSLTKNELTEHLFKIKSKIVEYNRLNIDTTNLATTSNIIESLIQNIEESIKSN